MRRAVLTYDDVHLIRISGLSDGHWERTLGVSRTTVNKARLGATWPTHPTPPDTAERVTSQRRGERPETEQLPQMSLAERTVSQLLARWPRVIDAEVA